MSWAEVFKINDNMKNPLNKQMRESRFLPFEIITSSTTYTPVKTGIYKILCVGAGGNGVFNAPVGSASGGGGGLAIKDIRLVKNTSYTISVESNASFAYDSSTTITASAGGNGTNSAGGAGGTASGGDYNYTGTNGEYKSSGNVSNPGSVGAHITELSRFPEPTIWGAFTIPVGDCILDYGGGGGAVQNLGDGHTSNGKPAAVIIIPIEMEE